MHTTAIKTIVKDRYARAALSVSTGSQSGCCGDTQGQAQCCDPIASNLYDAEQTGGLPEAAVLVPAEIRKSILLWVGCVAGALQDEDYRAKLENAGFEAIDIEPTRTYRVQDATEFLQAKGIDVAAIAPQVDGKFMSAFIRARKPLGSGSVRS